MKLLKGSVLKLLNDPAPKFNSFSKLFIWFWYVTVSNGFMKKDQGGFYENAKAKISRGPFSYIFLNV